MGQSSRRSGTLLDPWIRRFLLFAVVVSSVLSLCAVRVWCRLVPPPYMIDVRELGEKSPLVFRGHVSMVNLVGESPPESIERNAVATFQVDRWYRGKARAEASLHFVYGGTRINGHNCINFQLDTDWIVFADEKEGSLELIDDCIGALAVSPLLGADLGNADWLAQMEAVFLAGLGDSNSAARVISIQRLGGLKLPSSRSALHHVIEEGNKEESKWVIYAALRTGDVTVLPRVKELLAAGDHGEPESAMALELRTVTDPRAVLDLLAILNSAPGDLTRTCVLIALGEKLKDPRAVPSLAAHLSDPDGSARYDALDGLKNITHEEACTLPPTWEEPDVEPQVLQCKLWWEHEGKFRTWTQE